MYDYDSSDPFEEQTIDEIINRNNPRKKFGMYRGIVEDIDDPQRFGRVKVRVFAVHGAKNRTPTSALPWADVAEMGSGGPDYGSFSIPPVGSKVLINFEMGLEDFPIVIGGFRAASVSDSLNPNTYLTQDGSHPKEKPWKPSDSTNETPSDVFVDKHKNDIHPTRRVLAKSVKGHSIVAEDGDGKEHLRMTDRSGQVIEFYCPVHPDAQLSGNSQKKPDGTRKSCPDLRDGNSAQRGPRSALRGDALPQDAMRDKKAHIRIKDISGQQIMMNAKSMDESIKIVSKDSMSSSKQSIELYSGKGKEKIRVKDKSGSQILLDPNGDKAINISDGADNSISWKPNGSIVLNTATDYEINVTKSKIENIQGKHTGVIQGDSDFDVLCNKRLQVGNDAQAGVLGNTSLSLGKGIQLLVGNAVPSPTTSDPFGVPVDVSCVTGSIHLSTVSGNFKVDIATAGDIDIGTTAGDVSLATLLGDGNLTTQAGNIEVSSQAGNIDISTLAGQIGIDSTILVGINAALVQLGSLAIHPALKTTTMVPTWIALNTALGAAGVTAGNAAAGVPTPPTNAAAIAALGNAIAAYTTALTALLSASLSTKVFFE